MSPLCSTRGVVLVACLALTPLLAQEPAVYKAAKEFSEHALKMASGYESEIGSSSQRKLSLLDRPILRWSNPLGNNEAHGEVFLWTDRGRPAAVLSLYHFIKQEVLQEHHEFLSLAEEPLSFVGKATWSPAAAGIEVKRLPEGPAPAAAARQRLKQMRELAAEFSVDKTGRDGETRALRLLPQPIYRYDDSEEQVLDGALFAFVEGTDPETFLLLEARQEDKAQAWHYALARMNSVGLKARRSDKPIWEAPQLEHKEVINRKDKPYAAFSTR